MSRAHSYSHSRAHSPTFAVTSPALQLILQPFRRFTYVTAHSPTLPLLHLRLSPFSNPSFASPTSQVHLIHLASRPWNMPFIFIHSLSDINHQKAEHRPTSANDDNIKINLKELGFKIRNIVTTCTGWGEGRLGFPVL